MSNAEFIVPHIGHAAKHGFNNRAISRNRHRMAARDLLAWERAMVTLCAFAWWHGLLPRCSVHIGARARLHDAGLQNGQASPCATQPTTPGPTDCTNPPACATPSRPQRPDGETPLAPRSADDGDNPNTGTLRLHTTPCTITCAGSLHDQVAMPCVDTVASSNETCVAHVLFRGKYKGGPANLANNNIYMYV